VLVGVDMAGPRLLRIPVEREAITTVTLVRHGESGANRRGAYAGHTSTRLTQRGVSQARLAAECLSVRSVAAVLSGSLLRTRQTANIIASACGVSPTVDVGLDEIGLGAWQGLTKREIATRYPREWAIWRDYPDRLVMPGFEPLHQASVRVLALLGEVHRTRRGTHVVLVTHDALISLVALCALGLPVSSYRVLHVSPCSTSEFVLSSAGPILSSLNCTTHLLRNRVDG
jgi:broad specificity phosphatase PhoE